MCRGRQGLPKVFVPLGKANLPVEALDDSLGSFFLH